MVLTTGRARGRAWLKARRTTSLTSDIPRIMCGGYFGGDVHLEVRC